MNEPAGLFGGDGAVIDGLFGALKAAHLGLEPTVEQGSGAA